MSASMFFDSLKEEFPSLTWDEFKSTMQETLNEISGEEKTDLAHFFLLVKTNFRRKNAYKKLKETETDVIN